MYKLKDNQRQGTFEDKVFQTKEEVRDFLYNFHEQDLSEEEGVVYELHDLLDIGDWELLETNN